jgi:prefoldin subunit 5
MTPTRGTNDGPQAATRHVKDRRPSRAHSYTTQAGKAIAALERRITALDSRQQSTSPQSSPSKRIASVEVDTVIKDLGEAFNDLDERVDRLQKANERWKQTQQSVAAID